VAHSETLCMRCVRSVPAGHSGGKREAQLWPID
jgi:hypothetical protein